MKIHIIFANDNEYCTPVRAWASREVAEMVRKKLQKWQDRTARRNHRSYRRNDPNEPHVTYHIKELELNE